MFAAACSTEPFSQLGKSFEAAHPGTTVRFNFTGSQQLFLQIQQGAKADVFASADRRWMQTAKDSGLVEGEPVLFAHNELIVIVPVANPAGIKRLQDLLLRCKAGDRRRSGSGGALHLERCSPSSHLSRISDPNTTSRCWPASRATREREGGRCESPARRRTLGWSTAPMRQDRRPHRSVSSRFPMRPTSSRPTQSLSFGERLPLNWPRHSLSW